MQRQASKIKPKTSNLVQISLDKATAGNILDVVTVDRPGEMSRRRAGKQLAKIRELEMKS
jgi:hypothetical protein